MLSEYISGLYNRGMSYRKCGMYIMHVASFLEQADTINRRGYLKYRKSHIADVGWQHISIMSESICDFLATFGIGYKTTARPSKPLEKLDKVSEKNKELLANFLEHITTVKDYSPNTIATYRFGISSFFKYASEYNAENVRRFIQTLSDEGQKPSTIRLRITALEQFGNYIKKPIEIRRPKIQKSLALDNIPTESEYQKMLDDLNELGRD